jgi:hypothetical protein
MQIELKSIKIADLIDGYVNDPDTNESLGKLEIIKGTAKPIHIQENMTIIQSNRYNIVEDKKIIKKSSLFVGSQVEEIIEPRERTIKPFNNPAIGDFVKILNKVGSS